MMNNLFAKCKRSLFMLGFLGMVALGANAQPVTITSVSRGDALIGNRAYPFNGLRNGSFEDACPPNAPCVPINGTKAYFSPGSTLTPKVDLPYWTELGGGVQTYSEVTSNAINFALGPPTTYHGNNYLYLGNQAAFRINSPGPLPATIDAVTGLVTFEPGTTFGVVNAAFAPFPDLEQTINNCIPGDEYRFEVWVAGEHSGNGLGSDHADGFFELQIGDQVRYLLIPGFNNNNGLGSSERYQITFVPTTSTVTVRVRNYGHVRSSSNPASQFFINGQVWPNVSPTLQSTELIIDDFVVNRVLGGNFCVATAAIASTDLDGIICPGESVTLTASGAGFTDPITGFTWSTGAVTQAITVNPVNTTTYIVSVTDGFCTATANYTLTVQPSPACPEICNNTLDDDGDGLADCADLDCAASATITAGGPTTFCVGGNVVLTAGPAGAVSYLWSTGAATQSITVSTTNTFVVTVTNAQGCSAAASQLVTANPNPVISNVAATPQSCPAPLGDGTIQITASVATGVLEYSIDGGATFSVSNSFSNLANGSYNVVVQVQGTGCQVVFAGNPVVLNGPLACPEICNDIIDNDGDGLADCADPDCAVPVIDAVTPANPTCATAPTLNDGSIAVQASGVNLAYSIGGAFLPTNNFTGLTGGTYTVQVQNTATGCIATFAGNPVTLVNPVCPEICNDLIDNDGDGLTDCADLDCGTPVINGVTPSNPTCATFPVYNDGQIVVAATGANLQYSINNGGAFFPTATFTGLTAGGFNVVVQNSVTGCSATFGGNPVTIVNPVCPEICNDLLDNDGDGLTDCADPDCATPVINAVNPTSPTCATQPAFNDGTIAIIATGPNLAFSIDNGVGFFPTATFTGLSAGAFNVVVINTVTNCAATFVGNPITLANPTCSETCNDLLDNEGDGLTDCADSECQITLTLDYPASACVGPGTIAPVGGPAGGTYSALPAGLAIDAGTGVITLAGSLPGNYTVTYFIPQTAANCGGTVTDTILIGQTPVTPGTIIRQ